MPDFENRIPFVSELLDKVGGSNLVLADLLYEQGDEQLANRVRSLRFDSENYQSNVIEVALSVLPNRISLLAVTDFVLRAIDLDTLSRPLEKHLIFIMSWAKNSSVFSNEWQTRWETEYQFAHESFVTRENADLYRQVTDSFYTRTFELTPFEQMFDAFKSSVSLSHRILEYERAATHGVLDELDGLQTSRSTAQNLLCRTAHYARDVPYAIEKVKAARLRIRLSLINSRYTQEIKWQNERLKEIISNIVSA